MAVLAWKRFEATKARHYGLKKFLNDSAQTLAPSICRQTMTQEYLYCVSTRRFPELVTVFRTPLTTIKGAVTALMQPTTDDPKARSALLEESLTAVETLDSLLENLLIMNRIDSGMLKARRSPLDIVDLVSVVAELLRRNSRDYPLSIRLEEDASTVCLDIVLMTQALTNVLLNVVEHTPPGTPVGIFVEKRDRAIQLTISDEGPGVPPVDIPNLFARFFRGENAASGCVGLGLWVSKAIVEAHGGGIRASINRRGGLSIVMWFPNSIVVDKPRGAM